MAWRGFYWICVKLSATPVLASISLQPFELFIGLRYTRAKRRNHFISFISLASMLGIALGITALITVMSVMNGFQREVRSRILGVAAHIQVEGGDRGLKDWREVVKQTKEHKEVVAGTPYVNGQGLLSSGGQVRGAVVRGVLPETEDAVSDLAKHMKLGKLADLKPGEFGIVLGNELARALRVSPGEKITLITPQGLVTPAGLVPRLKQFTIVGVFSAGHYEYDSTLALMHVADAQKLYQLGDAVTGVRLKVADIFNAPRISRELAKTLTVEAYILDWSRQNVNYFRAIEIEKRMMFIILTLIIAVAAFNLVSTLVMVVTDKHPDIAILRTLGASPASIMKIFIVQGVVIGVIGTALGVIGGLLLAFNIDVIVPAIERTFNFQILSKEVYYISEIPSQVQWLDVWWIAGISLLLSLLATLYPSRRAAQVNPAEALRYE
jgi:lipoprotein-releasing system permease protein